MTADPLAGAARRRGATRVCEILVEAGLLATVLAVPLYFNIDDRHIF